MFGNFFTSNYSKDVYFSEMGCASGVINGVQNKKSERPNTH